MNYKREAGDFQPAAIGALLLCAFVGGTGWLPFRELQERGLHPLWTLAIVYIVSLVLLAVHARIRRASDLNSAWRDLLNEPALITIGLAFGTMNAAFFWTAKLTLPQLRTRKGHFLVTSSVAGRTLHKGSIYGASKWFVHGFGLNLAEEMAEWGGRCTWTSPVLLDDFQVPICNCSNAIGLI